eukprot:10441864-Prorocentrum_lima.AAC.1
MDTPMWHEDDFPTRALADALLQADIVWNFERPEIAIPAADPTPPPPPPPPGPPPQRCTSAPPP